MSDVAISNADNKKKNESLFSMLDRLDRGRTEKYQCETHIVECAYSICIAAKVKEGFIRAKRTFVGTSGTLWWSIWNAKYVDYKYKR